MKHSNYIRFCQRCGVQLTKSPKANGYAKYCKSVACRFWVKVDIRGKKECWPWKGSIGTNSKFPYGRFRYNDRIDNAHRVSYILTYGELKDEENHICHKCDNPICVNPYHLFEGTRQDNMDDMAIKGRRAVMRGEESGRAKITAADVAKIKRLRAKGWTLKRIGKKMGITFGNVWKILNGYSWNHVA